MITSDKISSLIDDPRRRRTSTRRCGLEYKGDPHAVFDIQSFTEHHGRFILSPDAKMPRHQNYKVDETPSDDDEREECPSGTSCEKRHNVLHHRKYKHLKVTPLVQPPTSEGRGAAGKKILNDCNLL